MTHVIAVAQRKGGVGKTTLAVCVAAELCRRGREVALIDSDPQRSACHWAELGYLHFPVYEMVLGNQAVGNWVNDLIGVSKKYEYVVVDTAPNDRALVAPIVASSLVLVPCTPSGLDIEATAQTLNIVNAVRSRRQEYHPPMIIVPNRVDTRTLEGQQLVEALTGFGEIVSPTIGYRSAFVRAFSEGRSIDEMKDGLAAHRDIQLLCTIIEKRLDGVQRLPR
jgi:chromosome partitioning protein